MTIAFADPQDHSLPLHFLDKAGLDALVERLEPGQRAWLRATGFEAGFGAVAMVPGQDGAPALALVGRGSDTDRARYRFALGKARPAMPGGVFHLVTDLSGPALDAELLGWLLAGYRFNRYKHKSPVKAELIAPDGVDAERLETIAAGEVLTRDLINTPTSDMGPGDLATAARDLATRFGAQMRLVEGDGLLEQNFPMVHAVGRAADSAPRLIDLSWGDRGPRLTLVGKGVCFDTGGLNIKPGASMGLMKKDMGGAATVLGLAQMIMALELPLRLRVLIPAVENAISGNAMRPGDVLTSRKGLTVEVNNTDAEGRLVLADALACADEERPDLVVSMATLTGAARVALGPDLVPFYATTPSDADHLRQASQACADPVWEMPFWQPYEPKIEPDIADLDNAPSGGMAGSVTAALFLRRFVTETPRYLHFDIYGWQPEAAPARPKGGVGQAARALLEALPELLEL